MRIDYRRHPILFGSASFITTLAVALAILIACWNWDWFTPFIARQASHAVGRSVTLAHFRILDLFSAKPTLQADAIVIGDPAGYPGESHFATIERLSVQVDAKTLWHTRGKRLVLPAIMVQHPEGDLRRNPNGEANWRIVLPSGGGDGSPAVSIGALLVDEGNIHFVDPKLKSDLRVALHSEQSKSGEESRMLANIHGTYAGQPFTASFSGGSLLSLRDSATPYPVHFEATAGPTRIRLTGTLADPVKLAGANLMLDLQGQDLADLYPILGIPLASTPAYHLRGHLDYSASRIRFNKFTGTVGHSDLNGEFDVDLSRDRPFITADLTSNQVDLADLGGFIGTVPGHKTDPGKSVKQKVQQANEAVSSNLFPDTPINLPKIGVADFKVHYKGKRIKGENIPLDNLETNLSINNGDISLDPLSFGVGAGHIVAKIALNPRGNALEAKADVDFRQLDFHRLMQSTKMFEGFGVIGGHAVIDGKGNSMARILGDGDGQLKLYMTGGDVSALMVDLAGLDFGRSLLSALGLPQDAKIRCMISDFGLSNGILDTKTLVLDTDEANIVGKGSVNLRNETVDFKITQDAKHFSIGSFKTPIDVTGLLKSPDIKPDPAVLAERAGAATVLGVFLTPLAALIPTIQLGLGDDHACDRLFAFTSTATEAGEKLPARKR